MRGRLAGALACSGIAAAWALGRLIGDGTWASGLLFFVPSPLAAAALLVAAGALARSGGRRRALLAAAVAIVPLVSTFGFEHRWGRPPLEAAAPDGPRLRIVHWNVLWGRAGLDAQADLLATLDADLVLLSEYPRGAGALGPLARLGAERRVLRRDELVAVARGRLEDGGVERTDGGKAWRLTWYPEVEDARPVHLRFVDLRSNLLLHRDPRLRWVTGLMERERPDLVVGDFNSPRRSSALSDLPTGYRHAYDAAGSGWSASWPVPLPLWAIDQCIVGPALHPTRYRLRSTRASDHRLQILDATLSTPAAERPPVS